MMINYRKLLKPCSHYAREELLFLNGGFTLKAHQMFSVHSTLEEFTNVTVIGYFYLYLQISPRGRWAYNRTLGPLLGKSTI